MVLQAVFEDYFQVSGRRGQSVDSAYSIVYRTPKDCQTGDWIAKKARLSLSGIIREHWTGEVAVRQGPVQVHRLQALLDLLQYTKKLN